MSDLNRKSDIKKNRMDRKIVKKRSVNSLIDDRSFHILLTIDNEKRQIAWC